MCGVTCSPNGLLLLCVTLKKKGSEEVGKTHLLLLFSISLPYLDKASDGDVTSKEWSISAIPFPSKREREREGSKIGEEGEEQEREEGEEEERRGERVGTGRERKRKRERERESETIREAGRGEGSYTLDVVQSFFHFNSAKRCSYWDITQT